MTVKVAFTSHQLELLAFTALKQLENSPNIILNEEDGALDETTCLHGVISRIANALEKENGK